MQCFRGLKEQGKTILLVTHDEVIAKMCDRIVYLEYGNIVGEKKE